VIGRDGRSAGLRAQVWNESGVVARAPRRAPSLACVFSDAVLTTGSRLLLHCSHTRCVMLGNESILACECEISMESGVHGIFHYVPQPIALVKQSAHLRISTTEQGKGPNLLATFSSGRLYMHFQ